MTTTWSDVLRAQRAAAWPSTPIEGFSQDSLRKYRIRASHLLNDKGGMTEEEQRTRLRRAIEIIEEAIRYSETRNYPAHVEMSSALEAVAADTQNRYYGDPSNSREIEEIEWPESDEYAITTAAYEAITADLDD